MIEIICRENQQEQEIQPPKNIRQVGSPTGRHKVYMEDYVYTYLRSQAKNNSRCAAVLLGKSSVSRDMRYTFINGAIECGEAVFQFENIYLDESFWEYIYTEQREYFRESVIVGWFVSGQGEGTELTAAVESAHRKYFAGRDKVLMLMDTEEQEEMFYIYEQGYLQKREGYYIYYEKNLAMQEYMVRKKEEEKTRTEPQIPQEEEPVWRSPESDENKENLTDNAKEKIFVKSSLEEPLSGTEKALQNYRQMMIEKRGYRVERHNRRFLYALTSFFMMVLCIVGITTINNYQKMKEVEDVLYVMKDSVEEKTEKSDLVVESIASDVKPLEEVQEEEKQEKEAQKAKNQEKQEKESQKAKNQEKQEKEKPSQDKKVQNIESQNKESIQKEQTKQTSQSAQEQQPAQAKPQYYTVQAGDTLESICLKLYQNKSMIAAMCQANGIENGDKIQAGQKLLLP